MTSRVWVGALALCLGGWLSGLVAQETVWRPVLRSPPTPARPGAKPGRTASGNVPGAWLGRPVPVTRASAPDADWGDSSPTPPPTYRVPASAGVVLASYQIPAPGVRPAAPRGTPTVPRPGEVIAASGPPRTEEAEEPASGEVFAAERPPAPLLPFKPAGEVFPVADWVERQPLTPPPQAAPPSVDGAFAPPPPSSRFYVNGEYLLWWTKNDHVPPLVATGDPANGALAGTLGQPATVVLFGGTLDRNPFSGARFYGGYWLDDCYSKAIEVGGFFLGQRSNNFSASSAMFPVLTRPFFDVNRGIEFAEQIAFPGRAAGSVTVSSPSQLWGLEANMKCNWCCGCNYRINLLGGFRYLNLDENVTVTENLQFLQGAGPPFAGATGMVTDSFSTHNQFYGGQVGVESRWLFGRFFMDLRGKVALGVTHEEIDIAGSQTLTNFSGTPSPLPGGLLALGTNIGHFHRDSFAVVPEVGINLGYSITPNLRAYVGYNFLYWSSVVRPGDQIDRNIDSALIPNFNIPQLPPTGQNRPAAPFKETGFWAQGLVFGVEFVF
jgi:hypothetical protein